MVTHVPPGPADLPLIDKKRGRPVPGRGRCRPHDGPDARPPLLRWTRVVRPRPRTGTLPGQAPRPRGTAPTDRADPARLAVPGVGMSPDPPGGVTAAARDNV